MRFELYRHTVGTKKDNQTVIHAFATSHKTQMLEIE